MEHLNYILTTVAIVCFMCYSGHVMLEAYSKCSPGTISEIGFANGNRGHGISVTKFMRKHQLEQYTSYFPYAALVVANNSLLVANIDPTLYTKWREAAILELTNRQLLNDSGIPKDIAMMILQYVRTPGQFVVNDWIWFISAMSVLAVISETMPILGACVAGLFCAICWLGRWLFMRSPEVEYNRQLFNQALLKLKSNNQGEVDVAVGKDSV